MAANSSRLLPCLHGTLVGTWGGYATSIQRPTPAAAAVQALAVSLMGLSPGSGAAPRCSERPGTKMVLHMQLRGRVAVQMRLKGGWQPTLAGVEDDGVHARFPQG